MKCRQLMLYTAAIAAFAIAPPAGANEIRLDSKITDVTVYSNCARVTRTADATITIGNHQLIFDEIPLAAVEGSIRALVPSEGIRVLGLTYKFETAVGDSVRMARIKGTLDTLWTLQIAVLKNRKAVLVKQQAMLERLAEMAIPATNDNKSAPAFDAGNWSTAYTLVARDLQHVIDSSYAVDLKIAALTTRCHVLEAELAKLQTDSQRQFRRVIVDVDVATGGKADVGLDYMIPNASWSSSYNAYLLDSNRVEINYFGQVLQSTGEDWTNVRLTLSTAQPYRASTPGPLNARLLASYELPGDRLGVVTARRGLLSLKAEVVDASKVADQFGGLSKADAANFVPNGFDAEYGGATQYSAATTFSTGYSTQFVTSRRETVPSGSQLTRTPIAVWTLDGKETLVARPQNQPYVFRFIKLTNKSSVPILPGNISLFAGADYVGQLALLELILPDQEFEMAFGADDRIEVKRETRNVRQKVDGDNRERAEVVSINFINHSGFERAITIEEALPFSVDNRIKVDIESVTPKPDSTDVDHIAKWQVNLAAAGKQSIAIAYKIEYPATMTLSGM